ncbi:MAG TPA: hypothetical protein VHX66_11545 [Solirubrobacteraceae bacterium]|jgi:hypothetical protein|nr:hypothetical protein [Solirubrobacteraceae bacterium]
MDRQRPYPLAQEASTIGRALRAAAPACGATRVLAIDGRSGSGKSTLAAGLAERLGGAPVVSLEDLYGGWDGLEHGVTLVCAAVLEPLAAGAPASVPRYDWHAAAWARPWTLDPPAELIVEGVGAGAQRLARFTSVLVWIELGEEARREHALADRGDRAIYEPHWERWARQEEEHYVRERPWERAAVCLRG